MDANDRWKNIDAQKQAKAETKVCNYAAFFIPISGLSNLF